MRRPALVLTDIEGTTTPISFVHSVLFPYARVHMENFLARRGHEPEVAAAVAEAARRAPGQDVLATLLRWMEQDAKETPLKTLQGIIWAEGYARGTLTSTIYDDVAGHLRAWHAAGVKLAVYSSGSVEAQKLLFSHTPDGDLSRLFSGFYDTRVGLKREAASYRAIADQLRMPASGILFLSDVGAELDAARAAGMMGCQLLRPADYAVPVAEHPQAADFREVAEMFYLPTA